MSATEAIIYPLPEQQAVSLKEQPQEQVKPFAFDLAREYERAQELGERGLPFFVAQAEYYAKETHGRVRIDEYEHRIKRDSDGNVTLVFGPDDQIAEDSYAKPITDPRFPEWYKKMSWNDVKWTRMMQNELSKANSGDKFFDISPTVFSIPIEERKKSGFGKHSFACVSEYVIEDGVEKLVSRPLRNYLDEPEHELLFALVTGKHVEKQFLPRTVSKLAPDMHIGHIEKTIEGLYDNTPTERKIIPDNDDTTAKSAEEMKAIFAPFENWLKGIYKAMYKGYSPSYIETQFHGWENALKAAIRGEEIDIKYFQDLDPDSILSTYINGGSTPLSEYTDRTYMAEDSSCGAGAGFSEDTSRRSEPMTYGTMTENSEKCPEIKCGKEGCTWKADEDDIRKIQSGRMTACPRCGWKPKG